MIQSEMTEAEVMSVMQEAAVAAAVAELETAAKSDRLPQWAAEALAAILEQRKEQAIYEYKPEHLR